jgi:hypothetical protein
MRRVRLSRARATTSYHWSPFPAATVNSGCRRRCSSPLAPGRFPPCCGTTVASAALKATWLASRLRSCVRGYVSTRISVMDGSFGGIETLVAAASVPGCIGAVDSSGAAESWSNPALRARASTSRDQHHHPG